MVGAISLPLPGNFAIEEIEAIAMEQGIVLAQMLGLENIMVEDNYIASKYYFMNRDATHIA